MPFKPNYGLQRSIRNSAKKAKAEEKLKDRQARVAARKEGQNPANPGDEDEQKEPE